MKTLVQVGKWMYWWVKHLGKEHYHTDTKVVGFELIWESYKKRVYRIPLYHTECILCGRKFVELFDRKKIMPSLEQQKCKGVQIE